MPELSPEDLALPVAPVLVNETTSNALFPGGADYVSSLNAYNMYAANSVQGDANGGVLETSQDGWRIAGVAWYWWVALIGLISGVVLHIRRQRIKHDSLLSNR